MSYVKNLSVEFTPTQKTDILKGINDAIDILNGVKIVTLEPDERKTIPNVEANRYAYVEKAVTNLGPEFKDLVSRAVKTENAKQALDSYDFLTQVQGLVLELNDRSTDLRHNLGNTTYNYTIDMYHEAQRYIGDLPGADTIVQELKPLFEDQGPQNPDTPKP